jgi:hypothetical protein
MPEKVGTVTEVVPATEHAEQEAARVVAKEAVQKVDEAESKTPEQVAEESVAAQLAEDERRAALTPEERDAEDAKKKEDAEKLAVEDADKAEKARRQDMSDRVRDALKKAKDESVKRASAEDRVAALETAFQKISEERKEQAKPYQELTLEEVERTVLGMEASIAELNSADRKLEARLVQRKLDKYIDFLEENEGKRKEYVAKQTEEATVKQSTEKRLDDMREASEFYRTQRQIPKDTWDAAGVWLSEYLAANPIEGRKFAELVDRQGAMAAYSWAEMTVSEHFAAQVETERKAVEKSKSNALGGTGASAPAKTSPDAEPVGDYFKRRDAEEKAKKGK